MKLKSLISSSILATMITTSVAAENLMDIYRQAVENDPIFLSAGAQLEANLEGESQSLSRLLPTLNGSFEYGYSKIKRN